MFRRRKGMDKVYAIVLAAGRGARMKSQVAKQYIELDGKPVLYYSLQAFEKSPVDHVILVTGENDIEYCYQEIVEKYGFTKVCRITAGGSQRYHSVWNGLKAVKEHLAASGTGIIETESRTLKQETSCKVLIHDGARCFVDQETIRSCITALETCPACVAAVPAKDTIKRVDGNLMSAETLQRDQLWIIQTPQAFDLEPVYDAYAMMEEDIASGKAVHVTDDTSVVEAYKHIPSRMVMSSYYNMKITTPEDLILGEAILRERRHQAV